METAVDEEERDEDAEGHRVEAILGADVLLRGHPADDAHGEGGQDRLQAKHVRDPRDDGDQGEVAAHPDLSAGALEAL